MDVAAVAVAAECLVVWLLAAGALLAVVVAVAVRCFALCLFTVGALVAVTMALAGECDAFGMLVVVDGVCVHGFNGFIGFVRVFGVCMGLLGFVREAVQAWWWLVVGWL
jgi:hypothetical protein